MANKVIDPAPIIKQLADRCLAARGLECSVLGSVIDMLRAAPAENAVEVVRCRDCYNCTKSKWCNLLMMDVKDEWFCSHGERKDNG